VLLLTQINIIAFIIVNIIDLFLCTWVTRVNKGKKI
jgi:hypothetical protein